MIILLLEFLLKQELRYYGALQSTDLIENFFNGMIKLPNLKLRSNHYDDHDLLKFLRPSPCTSKI